MKYVVKKIETVIGLESLVNLIKSEIIINGRVNPSISRLDDKIINEKNLCCLIDNIFHVTDFIKNDIPFSHRVNLILNNSTTQQKCECGETIEKLKIRNGKVLGFNDYCSQACANRFTNYKRSEEFYKSVSSKIVKTRKENNSYIPSDSFKFSNDISKYPKVVAQRKKTNLERYGVENPGVLGAFSSKSGEKFIREYISKNNIDENRCFFKNGGANGKEFYQMIHCNKTNKFIYVSYDLVVFKDVDSCEKKDLSCIELILEYNGPWHYKKNVVDLKGEHPSTPYKDSKTIKETFELDMLKMNHIKKYCDNFLIYWEKDKKFSKYEE